MAIPKLEKIIYDFLLSLGFELRRYPRGFLEGRKKLFEVNGIDLLLDIGANTNTVSDYSLKISYFCLFL